MLINHRQSSTAFVCFLSEENNLAFGVHRPMLPSSIKLFANWSSSQSNTYLLFSAVTASIPGNVTKKVKLLPRPSFSILYARNKKRKRKRGAGYPRLGNYCLCFQDFGTGSAYMIIPPEMKFQDSATSEIRPHVTSNIFSDSLATTGEAPGTRMSHEASLVNENCG